MSVGDWIVGALVAVMWLALIAFVLPREIALWRRANARGNVVDLTGAKPIPFDRKRIGA